MAIKIPLEVAVFSGESILKAQSQGCSRVELNAPNSYLLGGTTPPLAELARVADQVTVPVRVMIRPRGPPNDGSQDFIYTESEVAAMARSIEEFKASGLMNPCRGDGFVFGLLKPCSGFDSFTGEPQKLQIHEEQCKTLLRHAKPYGCVFHRAFDAIASTKRAYEGIELLLSLNFEGVLTAGGPGNCIDNIDRLNQLCHKYMSKGIFEIVAAGGLRENNILIPARTLARYEQGTVWLHTAALSSRPDHPMEEIDSDELIQMVAQLDLVEAA
ncbi:hypothetical protein E4U13_008126 [Claviceps humidiphila]|uniref:Copper homeostasis protein cutC homolog n=1 Tax=Claviceps humidiphila TaxID=1294629 RepID=A0A9P7Q9S8_9HYPO|nr:hypothetical protein E4U13_008126 [Claviceps humidiphila]